MATPSDQQQLNELLALLNTAPMPPTLTIADIHGNPLTVTVPQYYALIGSYGQQTLVFKGRQHGIVLNSTAAPMFTSTMRIMNVSPEPSMEGVMRARGGIFELPEGLTDGDTVTVCSPVGHGYLEVWNARGAVFTVAIQEVDCDTLYEISGLFLPPRNQRVSAEVARQRMEGKRQSRLNPFSVPSSND